MSNENRQLVELAYAAFKSGMAKDVPPRAQGGVGEMHQHSEPLSRTARELVVSAGS